MNTFYTVFFHSNDINHDVYFSYILLTSKNKYIDQITNLGYFRILIIMIFMAYFHFFSPYHLFVNLNSCCVTMQIKLKYLLMLELYFAPSHYVVLLKISIVK